MNKAGLIELFKIYIWNNRLCRYNDDLDYKRKVYLVGWHAHLHLPFRTTVNNLGHLLRKSRSTKHEQIGTLIDREEVYTETNTAVHESYERR